MLHIHNQSRDTLKNPAIAKGVLNSGTTLFKKVIVKAKANRRIDYRAVTNTQKGKIGENCRVFICKYCCCRSNSQEFLKNHITQHGKNPKHICHVCGHKSNTFSSLMVHFLKHSNSRKVGKLLMSHDSKQNSNEAVTSNGCVTCKNCNTLLKNYENLQSHNCQFSCHKGPIAGARSDSPKLEDTELHTQHDSSMEKWPLSEDSPRLTSDIQQNAQNKCVGRSIRSEIDVEKNNSDILTSCTPQATRKSVRLGKKKRRVFTETILKDTENETHKDNQCYQQHAYDVAMYDKLELFCHVCSLSFTNKKNLMRHQQMHTEKPSFMCRFCGKFFHRKDIHNRHEKTVHRTQNCKLHCFYCKYIFCSPTALKDHVLSTHSDGDIQPYFRIPSCSAKNRNNSAGSCNSQCVSSKAYVENHQSIGNISHQTNLCHDTSVTKDDESSPSGVREEIPSDPSNGISMKYKCGKCLKPFNVLQHLLKHFQSFHNVSFGSPKSIAENSHSISDSCESNHSATEDGNCFTSSSTQLDNCAIKTINSFNDSSKLNFLSTVSHDWGKHEECKSLSPHNVKYDSCGDLLNTSKNDISVTFPNNDQEAMEVPSFRKSTGNILPSSSNETCSLCLQKFSSQSAFLSHQQHMHKVIDWYRCCICGRCGPKKSVAEHMMTHMQEIGSFVVNGNEQNFSSLLPYLPASIRTMVNGSDNFAITTETEVS